jgi:ribose transport system substrate-binding protein
MKPANPNATTPERSAPDYSVRAVVRACAILKAFQTPEEVLQLNQVALKTAINKVTVFRLLATLVGQGVVERVGVDGYRSKFQPLHTRRYRIGYAAQSSVIPFIGTVTDSIVAAARQAGIELLVLNNKSSRRIALRNAAQFARRKVDLVIECQLHVAIANTLSEQYAHAGIPVISLDAPQPGAVYFGADNYKAGHIGGNHLGRWAAINWQGQVDEIISLTEPAAGAILRARALGALDGIQDVLQHSNRVPVFRYEIRPSFEASLIAIRKHLRRSKARHILVGPFNDPTALGALQAFRDFGREENCAIVGQGAVIEARHEMRRSGSRFIGSVAYFPEIYGEKILRIATDMLENRPVPRMTLVHHQIVHPLNVNKIYPNDLLMDLKS